MLSDFRLDAFYMDYALGGWLMGGPDHAWLASHALQTVGRMWGSDRPVLMVPPGVVVGRTRMCLAWLYGPSVEGGDWGHLVVIWYQDEEPTNPLELALQHVEAHGGWEAHAKGFWY